MLISSEIFTYGLYFLKNLVDLHWVPNDMHMVQKCSFETALWLSLWVYNVDIKPGLIYEGVDSTEFCFLAHASFVMSVLFFFFALSPLCIHGNSCPNGSATSKVNNVKSYILLTIIIGRNKHQRLSCCNPKRGRIHLWWYPLMFIFARVLNWGLALLFLFGFGIDIVT